MQYDFIIIGAGSAGCVLANRLSADPSVSVLLLEAGGPDKKLEIHIPGAYAKLNRTAVDWGYSTEPQPHVDNRRMYLPRGKTLGGCSSTNAMAYIRGNRLDYDDWAALGNEGWSFEEVLPYFIRSEHNEQIDRLDRRYHGADGPMNVTYATRYQTPLANAFVRACVSTGVRENHDFNGAEQEGAGLFQFTIKNGRRHSTATAFLKPVLHRPNLTVMTHAHTRRILFDKGGTSIRGTSVRGMSIRATGVEVITGKNNTEKLLARREVIVAAGAFNSPQLLMLSGIGPADDLRRLGIDLVHELPGVGQNLQDHLFTGVSSLCSQRVTANHHLTPFNQFRALVQYMVSKKGPLTISPLEANAFVKLPTATDRPNLQLHFAPVHLGADYSGDLYDLTTYPTTDGYTILPTLLKPRSRGYVALRSANPLEAPVIQPNFLSVEADRQLLLDGIKKAMEVMRADAFGSFCRQLILPPDQSSDEAIMVHARRMLETVYHPVGTCKMGSGEEAVVDSRLRVHGVEGLRVADASIMPVIVSGNTNAACIMIGEKASDLILEEQKMEVQAGVN